MVGVRRRAGSGGDEEGCLVSFHGAGTGGAKLWENRDRKGQQRCMFPKDWGCYSERQWTGRLKVLFDWGTQVHGNVTSGLLFYSSKTLEDVE
jgi:hypothetical protein